MMLVTLNDLSVPLSESVMLDCLLPNHDLHPYLILVPLKKYAFFSSFLFLFEPDRIIL